MRPSDLLGISPTDPSALLVDLTVNHRAQVLEAEEGIGEFWWLSLLRALTGAGNDERQEREAPIDWSNVKWL